MRAARGSVLPPADPRLASFIGEANLLEGVVSGATVKTLLGVLPLDPAAGIPGTAVR